MVTDHREHKPDVVADVFAAVRRVEQVRHHVVLAQGRERIHVLLSLSPGVLGRGAHASRSCKAGTMVRYPLGPLQQLRLLRRFPDAQSTSEGTEKARAVTQNLPRL